MEKFIKRVFDVSKAQKVDLMVAKAKVFEELKRDGLLNNAEFTAAEEFIKDYYEPLCEEYAKTGFEDFDAKSFVAALEENAEN